MEKKLYVTTAIHYVNAAPHIGNAIDYLLADIWASYQRQNGHDVRYQTGTDEHGQKVAAKAAEAGLDPQAYTDKMYVNFENLAKKLGASYTDFIRTTDQHHIEAAQYIWQKLSPYIYKGNYEGWYCEGCEAFVTDQEATANGGMCPDHQKPYQRLSEENYYFKTSAFTDVIRKAIESDELKIVPEFRKKEVLDLMKNGIQDVSISRPKKNMSWGVPVPGDEQHVMYVWVDALSNYITVLGYPDQEGWQQYWPADLQVIGKDILRFHALIWPAMLAGLELPMPKVLLAHGFVNVAGAKMSKSVGNVIDPNEIIDNYGTDAFRYYFSRHVPTLDDGDFTWEKFENAYNTELCNDLGNLVQRVSAMLKNYQAGVIGEAHQTEHDMDEYHKSMARFEFDRALDEVWAMVRSLNQYLETVKPWEIAKRREKDPEAEGHLAEVLAHSAGALLQIGDLLLPFMPSTTAAIHKVFDSGVVTPLDGVLFPKRYIHTVDPAKRQSAEAK